MKVGIDSYCYHRFFGEVYDAQKPPPKEMTLEDFLKRAKDLGVDGVSLESCFFPRFDSAYLTEVKGMLDEYGLDLGEPLNPVDVENPPLNRIDDLLSCEFLAP